MTLPKARILLVDDLPANLHTLSGILSEEYELSIAMSGADALKLARETDPDLILLDVMMPQMDGYETLCRLRACERCRHIPVIMVTTDDRTETQVSGLDLGADDFIAKPLVVPVLKARVRNVLGRRREQGELLRLATTDNLTGALNRLRFMELGEGERGRHKRYGQPCGLLMLDLDHFKRVNDAHGHAAGDTVLKAFAGTVAGLLRHTDLFARIGGEEFALLLPQTDRNGTLNLAERLRAAVAGIRLDHEGGAEIAVTVSVGVSRLLPADGGLQEALARADAALYEAKAAGRNCVRENPGQGSR
jgi:diguanylate cyclase (GGDEF)-like protein